MGVPGKKIPKSEKVLARRMRREGHSVAAICKRLDRSPAAIRAIVARTTPKNKGYLFRKLPKGVQLITLANYLKAEGNPRWIKKMQDLVYRDTEIDCGKNTIQILVTRWRTKYLRKCSESLQLAYKANDIYYEVYRSGRDGPVEGFQKIWEGILRNAKLIVANESPEPEWHDFFKKVMEPIIDEDT